MAKKPDGQTKFTGMRRQAEELLRTTKRDIAAMPVKDVQQLVYELQVHEIELEMQNDELRRTQVGTRSDPRSLCGSLRLFPSGLSHAG